MSLTTDHRTAQLAVRSAALADLLAIWPAFDLEHITATWPAVEASLLLVIRAHAQISAGLASRYYRDLRSMLAPGGAATPRIAPLDEDGIVRGLRVVGPVNAARQLARNRRLSDVQAATLVNLAGETGRHVLNAGRATLTASLAADRQARGVQRVTDRDPCRWCADQASRTYPPTERFPAHAHCACMPAPVY